MSRSAISHARVRALLSSAAGGARVMDEAVRAVTVELERHLAAIVERAARKHARELAARRVHGVYPGSFVRADHVLADEDSGEVADAPEVR